MNWLRAKLRNWLIGDVDKKLALALQTMKAIEAQGLENIQQEMGSMFYTFHVPAMGDPLEIKKQVAVKEVLSLLLETFKLYVTVEKDHNNRYTFKDELYPVIKKIRKPVEKKRTIKKGLTNG